MSKYDYHGKKEGGGPNWLDRISDGVDGLLIGGVVLAIIVKGGLLLAVLGLVLLGSC